MRLYILYVLAALLNYFPIVVFWGMPYAPVAFVGSVLLLIVAAPLILFNKKYGMFTGLIGCILMLFYSIRVIAGILIEDRIDWAVLLIIIPALIVLISTYLTIKYLFKRVTLSGIPSNATIKTILAIAPIALFVLYLIFYGQYWSWEMFTL